jgi:hypothetical protein
MKEAGLLYILKSTYYYQLKDKGLIKYRYKKRPKLTQGHILLRLKFAYEYRHFNFKRRTIKFSNKYIIKRGQGQDIE